MLGARKPGSRTFVFLASVSNYSKAMKICVWSNKIVSRSIFAALTLPMFLAVAQDASAEANVVLSASLPPIPEPLGVPQPGPTNNSRSPYGRDEGQ